MASSSSGEEEQSSSESSMPDTHTKSKRISKDKSGKYWIDFGKRHPEKWQELHYMREIITGKTFELKMLRLRLKQKTARYFTIANPETTSLKKILES